MITTSNLTVRYPRAAIPAVFDLNLHISEGETVLLLGPSGSGKSTLAQTLAGLIPHNIFARVSGELQVSGIDVLTARPGELASQVGLLFQDAESSFATLVVEDEIAFGLENLQIPPGEMPARIQSSLSQVGLPGFRFRRLETLSGGEAQQIALAALLAMSPAVLILDEPTANLDPRSTREFFETLTRLRGQRTILLIEHKLDACFHLVDRVILLKGDGSLLAAGDPKEVYNHHLQEIEEAGIWIPDSYLAQTGTTPSPVRTSTGDESEAAVPAVSVRGLTFAYPNQGPVLRDLFMDIPQGDFLALIGANGSGKSTLACHLMGLLPEPPQGEIEIFGDPIASLSLAELTERVGYVFQNPEHQFVTDNVEDELAYSLKVRKWPEAEITKRVDIMLARFQLNQQAQQNPFTLSQGQKRRLSVATMLAAGQKLLILDEPTFGQDRRTASALMDSLVDLNRRGVTILMISHDMRLVRNFADRVAVLVDGQIIFTGPPEEAFTRPDILDAARLR
jgi:energy-coupling factor transporter ATP-binding protein EcfA2